MYDQIETFVLFIGHGRSGHSLVGSFLDAHQHLIIAHEYFILAKINDHPDVESIYQALIKNSRDHVENGRFNPASVYEYRVDHFPGQARPLKIIGDKSGGNVSLHLRTRPWALDQLREMLDIPLKFIHVVRNPFDNIATLSLRNKWDLRQTIDYYMRDEMAVERLMAQEGNIYTFQLESLIDSPDHILTGLCDWLGVSASSGWLQACQDVLYEEPSITRHQVDWEDAQIYRIEQHIKNTEYMEGYRYDSEPANSSVS